jgi:translation initiation factor IF-3
MDYGRFKYEQAKKENEARKNQKTTELKEIRMKPHTDTHDLMVKVRKIEEFLGDGDKVKVGVLFRGRELAHTELGRQLLEKIIGELKGIGTIERPPIMEGKMMSMMVSRAPGWEPPKKTATADAKNGRPPSGSDSAATATPEATNGAASNGALSHDDAAQNGTVAHTPEAQAAETGAAQQAMS